MEHLRTDYERQIQKLRERIEHEESMRKRLQEELQTINSVVNNGTQAINRNQEEAIKKGVRSEYDEKLRAMQIEHKYFNNFSVTLIVHSETKQNLVNNWMTKRLRQSAIFEPVNFSFLYFQNGVGCCSPCS